MHNALVVITAVKKIKAIERMGNRWLLEHGEAFSEDKTFKQSFTGSCHGKQKQKKGEDSKTLIENVLRCSLASLKNKKVSVVEVGRGREGI